MPIYDYKCDKCGDTIEVIRKMSDQIPQNHHELTGEDCVGKVSQILAPSALIFKGSGFYITDYRGK
jgi:putative FmdB family regulatory protein